MTEEQEQNARDQFLKNWHQTQGVMILMIVTLVAQVGGIFWFAATVNQRVFALEKSVEAAQVREALMADLVSNLRITAGTITTRLDYLSAGVRDIQLSQERTQELLRQLSERQHLGRERPSVEN